MKGQYLQDKVDAFGNQEEPHKSEAEKQISKKKPKMWHEINR